MQESDWKPLEDIISRIFKKKNCFERLKVSISDLLKMLKHNNYKFYWIKGNILDRGNALLFRCSRFIDLCSRPLVSGVARINSKAFVIMNYPYNNQLKPTKPHRILLLLGLEIQRMSFNGLLGSYSWRKTSQKRIKRINLNSRSVIIVTAVEPRSYSFFTSPLPDLALPFCKKNWSSML